MNAAVTTVMCLGDSLTSGFNGVTDFDAGYRQDLLNDLTAQGKQIQFVGTYDPTTYTGAGYDVSGYSPAMTALGQNYCAGYSGYTSQLILQNLNGNVQPSYYAYENGVLPNMGGYWMTGGNGTGRGALDPNVVLLMIATNDAGRGLSLTDSEASIAGILQYFAVNLPNTVVITATPPLTTSQPQANQTLLGLENWEPGFIAANYPQDGYVDMVPVVPSADINTIDGVHPTDAGYSLIASAFDNALAPDVSAVPEPSTVGILAVGAMATLRRRCRRA